MGFITILVLVGILLPSRRSPDLTKDGECTYMGDVGKIYSIKQPGTIPLYRFRCTGELWGNVYSPYDNGGIDFYGLDQQANGNCQFVEVLGDMHDTANPGSVNVPVSPVPLNIYLCGDPQKTPYAYRFLTSAPPEENGCSLYTKTFSSVGYVLPP